MIHLGLKVLDEFSYGCGLFDGIELADEHLVFVTPESGAEKGSEGFPVQAGQFLLDTLQPDARRARETQDGHGYAVGVVDCEHLKVLFAKCFPQLWVITGEHREVHGWWLTQIGQDG